MVSPSRHPVDTNLWRERDRWRTAGRRSVVGAGLCRDTTGMKTAISVPDGLYEQAERLAQRTSRSRSEIYSAALREYVARHDFEEVTRAVDRVLARMSSMADPFSTDAANRTLRDAVW